MCSVFHGLHNDNIYIVKTITKDILNHNEVLRKLDFLCNLSFATYQQPTYSCITSFFRLGSGNTLVSL